MKKLFTSAMLMMLGITAMNAQTTIYSWESPDGTPVETGGTIAYVNGDGDRLNYPQAGYYTICLNGKKANMNDAPSANAGKMVITLDQALQAGDVINMTAFINKNESKEASPYIVFENGTTLEGEIFGDESNVNEAFGNQPTTKTMTVPEAAAGSKTITMTRSKAGTNLFINKLTITRAGGSQEAGLQGKLVIGKVFYAGSTRLNGATPKNYMKHLYIELYNNSAETIDVAGTYIALANTDAAANAWTAEAMAAEHPDSAVVKQIFQIPADKPVQVAPGKSIVVTNCAIDHSEIAEGKVDLSNASFETKSSNNAFNDHSEAVPELKVVKSFGTADYMNFLNPGPDGIILLPADLDLATCPETFAKGKTTGNKYTIVPLKNSIDCVDIVKQKTPAATDKRFAEAYDKGFTCTADPGNYNCQSVARKVAKVEADGRLVLMDTNNSTVDFESFKNVQPCVYNVPAAFDVEVKTVAEFIAVENGKVVKLNLDGIHVNAYNPLLYLAYIEDETGVAELNLKKTGITFESGDQLKGFIVGEKQVSELDFMGTYPNMMEHQLKPNADTNDYNLTVTAGTVTPVEATVAEAAKEGNHGKVMKLTNLTVEKVGRFWYGCQGDDRIQLNDELSVMPVDYEWPAAIETLTGIVTYNGVRWQIAPLTAESVTTGISTLKVADEAAPAIFNLQGQPLQQLQKGINIVNGKKVMVR